MMRTVILFTLICVIVLSAVARHYWRRYARECPQRTFNFRITDIWAAMIGLIPAVLLIANAMDSPTGIDLTKDIVFAVYLGLGQLVGLFVGRIHIELVPYNGAKNAWNSGISILAGAIYGAFLMIAMGVSAIFIASSVPPRYFLPTLGMLIFVVALFEIFGYRRMLRLRRPDVVESSPQKPG